MSIIFGSAIDIIVIVLILAVIVLMVFLILQGMKLRKLDDPALQFICRV